MSSFNNPNWVTAFAGMTNPEIPSSAVIPVQAGIQTYLSSYFKASKGEQ